MATTTQFLVPVDPRAIAITSVTSEATGHPIEFAFDRNLNTYWVASSTATQELILDLGSAFAIDSLVLFIRNYTTTAGVNATVVVEYSDNGTSWTQFTQLETALSSTYTVGTPLVIKQHTSAQTHRYWRLTFYFFNPVMQIAQLWLCRTKTISVPNTRPENDKRIYGSRVVHGPGGRENRAPINILPVYDRTRTWLTASSADLQALQDVVDLCGGRENLLIHKPAGGTAEVIELRDRRFSPGRMLYGLWKPTITFRTWPYIEAGEAF
jgi:hypothetical protein